GPSGGAELVRRCAPERAADRDHPLGPDAEEAAQSDELRSHLTLQLVELCDPSRLDQLTEARGDPRTDPAQLLHPPGGDELADRRLRLANRFRGAAVRARRVVAGARQAEQG